jgi:hypothetical protein
MAKIKDITFVDNQTIKDRCDKYESVHVNVQRVLESWRNSLFAFEWILPDGRIKDVGELPPEEQEKRNAVENLLQQNVPLEKPVLGIGLLENVEIGIGRHIFLAVAAHGLSEIPVHIPKSHKEDFEPFLS